MENVEKISEGANLYVFLIVLVALISLFILVGTAIKTFREIKKPHDAARDEIKLEVKELKHQVARIETVIASHTEEINDIRHTNRIQCQAVRALLNHAIHDGNTDEMLRAAGALDDYLTTKI